MRVFGTVSKYTLDMMGQAVMAEQFEKAQQGLLPSGSWYGHILPYEIAKLFQANNFDPSNITKLLTEYNVAKMDLVFLPLHHDQFWYLVVANFRHGRFEVLCPNLDLDSIQCNAEKVIFNFKMTFKCAYPRFMLFNIFQMTTTFRSVICSKNHCDTGVFVMKLMQSHDGDKQHLFEAEDAKPLRECMAYYMLTHPLNEKYDTLVDTKRILNMHGVTVGWHQ
ncbi:unnamed protein product [Urochloa decumbens]|uniref:Ubiquitin-like protease family profile domain-containing protein n=1 Tax=Urochloa decumbens TaxID=240449 RepID=A0ABC9EWE1_9POAL